MARKKALHHVILLSSKIPKCTRLPQTERAIFVELGIHENLAREKACKGRGNREPLSGSLFKVKMLISQCSIYIDRLTDDSMVTECVVGKQQFNRGGAL